MSEEKDKKSIKIDDKRRFDSTGNERADTGQVPTDSAARPAAPKSQAVMQEARESAPAQEESITFSAFIMSLATQTLMQLGEMKPPPGLSISIDKEAARQTIDIIRLLQAKTKGNLDSAEAKLLDEILHALMMSYVKVTS